MWCLAGLWFLGMPGLKLVNLQVFKEGFNALHWMVSGVLESGGA